MKGGFTDIINTLFYTKHYHSLSKRGGGFSFDSKGVCIVSAGSTLLGKDTQLLQKKLTTVENTVFDDLDLGLLGVYKKTHSSEEKAEVRVALIVGLDNPQLDWVWKRLARFLASHQHFIM